MKTRLLSVFAVMYATASLPPAASAQVVGADTLRLTLQGASSLAAQRNPAVVAARARVSQSEARVLESRSSMLPHLSAYAADGQHTMNTATFGLDFPSAPGEPPRDRGRRSRRAAGRHPDRRPPAGPRPR